MKIVENNQTKKHNQFKDIEDAQIELIFISGNYDIPNCDCINNDEDCEPWK